MYISRLIILAIFCMDILAPSTGQSNELVTRASRRRQRHRQSPRRGHRGGGLPSDLEDVYHAAASDVTPNPQQEEERSMSDSDPWQRYIPNTPSASEVECYVEVYVVRRQGGRCIRLGGAHRTAGCQSGEHFAFAPECEEVLSARENHGATANPEK